MKTTLGFASRKSMQRTAIAASLTASLAMSALTCAPAAAGSLGRALNSEPLPPGLASPSRPGPIASQAKAPPFAHPQARRVCVAWGRVCVKAGQGTKTHPAPCEQYEYVCKKYG